MYCRNSIFFMSNLTGADDGGVIINKKEAQAA